MKRLLVISAAWLAILPAIAQAPQQIVVWKSADLKAYAATLAPKINAQKFASQPLANFGFYNTQVAYREGSGEAEYHENAADLMVIQTGVCTLILGGTINGGRTAAPGEIRGTSIEGGNSFTVGPGDIIHIPPKTPHQMVLPAGGQITYFVVKEISR
ncbi:MAG: cupin domain-containing protein [Bryobacteraceae bacterium]|jgi:mannose-6-phosphate isomerase-like protein (cupin superfamily)